MSTNNGGPAFPAGYISKTRPAHDPGADFRVTAMSEPAQKGMSLRDYFAAKAVCGLIASDAFHGILYQQRPDAAAAFAYEVADAMLAAREVTP